MFDTVVLSGGGWNGLLSIGSLVYIFETCNIDQIHTFVGTSSGAIICYLLCIGFCLSEIIENIFDMKLYELFNKNNTENYISLFQDKYVYDFSKTIGEILKKLSLKKMSTVPTLMELYDHTNKEFICYSLFV